MSETPMSEIKESAPDETQTQAIELKALHPSALLVLDKKPAQPAGEETPPLLREEKTPPYKEEAMPSAASASEEGDEAPLAASASSEETPLPKKEAPYVLPPSLMDMFVSSWTARQHVSPSSLSLDSIDVDETFRLHKKDDNISALVVELARLGQLMPIDVRLLPSNRFQVIAGFRRLEALRFLHRDKVIARIHLDLSDMDAWLLALASSIYATPASKAALLQLQASLEKEGKLQPVLKDMLERALTSNASAACAQENADEIDADELAADVAMRMASINQDLSLVADVFLDLEPAQRAMLLKQLRYASDMVAYLERL